MTSLRRHSLPWLALALLSAGCSLLMAPDVTPTRFFVLTAVTGPDSPAAKRPHPPIPGIAIGVGPVTLPAYLDRPQMVTRIEPNELEVSESDRWAEPLRSSFPRVLAEDLSKDVGTDRVVVFPWYKAALQYQVKVEVLNFEPNSDGRVSLDAIWTLYIPESGKSIATQQTALRRETSEDVPDALAGGLSGLVADLAHEIASAIRKNETQRKS